MVCLRLLVRSDDIVEACLRRHVEFLKWATVAVVGSRRLAWDCWYRMEQDALGDEVSLKLPSQLERQEDLVKSAIKSCAKMLESLLLFFFWNSLKMLFGVAWHCIPQRSINFALV